MFVFVSIVINYDVSFYSDVFPLDVCNVLYLSDVSCKSCSMKVNKMFVFSKKKK